MARPSLVAELSDEIPETSKPDWLFKENGSHHFRFLADRFLMFGSLLAGLISGFVLGFLGAGGTVVGLPFLLIFDRLGPHNALGTNALGVSLIAAALLIWRIRNKQILLTSGVMFALPGLVGVMQGPGSLAR